MEYIHWDNQANSNSRALLFMRKIYVVRSRQDGVLETALQRLYEKDWNNFQGKLKEKKIYSNRIILYSVFPNLTQIPDPQPLQSDML